MATCWINNIFKNFLKTPNHLHYGTPVIGHKVGFIVYKPNFII